MNDPTLQLSLIRRISLTKAPLASAASVAQSAARRRTFESFTAGLWFAAVVVLLLVRTLATWL